MKPLKRRKSRPKKKRSIIDREQPQAIEDEAIVIQYMIMHHNVCDAAYQYYNQGQLKLNAISSAYKKIYKKVLKYYKDYGKSPKRAVSLMIKTGKQSEDITIEESMLEGIASEYEANRKGYKISPRFIINEVLPRFIRSITINSTLDSIEKALTRGHLEKAEDLFIDYERITSEPPDISFGFTSPLTLEYHKDLARRKADIGEEAFSFPPDTGDLRHLVGPLKRKWLVSVSGSTKSGKSYFLWEMAIRAALTQKKKVMMFSPEMTEEDMIEERFMPWLLERPANIFGDQKYDYIPVIDCMRNQLSACTKKNNNQRQVGPKNRDTLLYTGTDGSSSNITADSKTCLHWITCTKCRGEHNKHFQAAVFWNRERLRRAISTYKDQLKMTNDNLDIYAKKHFDNLKIKYFPKYKVSIEECIDAAIRYKEKHNWKPDIIMFDYLDILRLTGGSEDQPKWQKIDHMWKIASGFAQGEDALVVTAEQTTGAGRTKRLLDHTVTPEAQAKDHHLNKKIGIAKYEDETNNNICRANIIYDRHRPFDRSVEVLITQDLTHAYAVTDSVFWHNIDMPPYPIKLPERF